MTSASTKTLSISQAYKAAANDHSGKTPKDSSPYSIRLTQKERAYLKEKAGNRPLSAYIRDRLLGDQAEHRRELRRPQMSQSQYAALLANLGASRMSSNLNQLAKHANMGTLGAQKWTQVDGWHRTSRDGQKDAGSSLVWRTIKQYSLSFVCRA